MPRNFYPRSPYGERRRTRTLCARTWKFLSTLSLRRATSAVSCILRRQRGFLSTLSLRRATYLHVTPSQIAEFLSTLSLRRATYVTGGTSVVAWYFYPRSPYGERRRYDTEILRSRQYFYPRSPYGERLGKIACGTPILAISIHALLTESDMALQKQDLANGISIHALLTESDPMISSVISCRWPFLSTLSLRRATGGCQRRTQYCGISIHALLTESDPILPWLWRQNASIFLSTLSLRRATNHPSTLGRN